MRRYWLLFAQTVTVALALWFIVTTLKPGWMERVGSSTTRVASVSIQEASPNAPLGANYRAAAEHAMPSVVNIFTSKESKPANPFAQDPLFRRFFGDRENPENEDKLSSLGSGVIISADGYILTNNHVVETADQIEVALSDGRKAAAKVIGNDPETDLAVIKISLPDLPAITLGRDDEAKVGDIVLAIGNPFGVGQSMTMGIISALGRSHLNINDFENFIQTDAAINPGNSGGALVDTHGNLLGINTAIYSRSGGSLGIGFAVPVSTAKAVMESIITSGQVVRGYIGVEPQDITPELAEGFGLPQTSGVIIAGVRRGEPADRAGVKAGDIVVSINGNSAADTTAMMNQVSQIKPGSQAKLVLLRKSKKVTLNIVVGKRPPPKRLQEEGEEEEEIPE